METIYYDVSNFFISRLKAEVPVCGMETLIKLMVSPTWTHWLKAEVPVCGMETVKTWTDVRFDRRLKAEVPVCGMETKLPFKICLPLFLG